MCKLTRVPHSLQLEPRSTKTETGPGAAAELDFGPGVGPDDDADAVLAYLLGYDLDPASVRNIVGGGDPCHDLAVDDPNRLRQEEQILSLFADLSAISRRQPEHEEDIGEQLRGPKNTSSPASEAMTSTAIVCRARSSIVCCGWCTTTGIRISTRRANSETPSCACTTRDSGWARCCLRSLRSSSAASLMSSCYGRSPTTTCAAFSIT